MQLRHGGTPNLSTIAPVIYMWRPNQQPTDADAEIDRTNGLRQVWIWIHAAALTEGYNALKNACESRGKVELFVLFFSVIWRKIVNINLV